MCGINGFFNTNDLNLNELKIMTVITQRRGPDNSDIYFNSDLMLGFSHNRLSIIETSSNSNQPMLSLSGKSIIVFNGEIYNFKKLAEKLNLSNSVAPYGDTRVLIEYIQRFGIKDTLRSIDGMYAFAYYSFEQDSLHIARDKYGQKPLYYFIGNNNSIVFSSDILAIKTALKVSKHDLDLNKKGVEEYFKYGYVGGHQSIYGGISKLPANRYMEIKRSGYNIEISTKKYDYQVNKDKLNDVEQAVTKFNNIFQKVLGDFQYADVPLGVFLSGGIDSTAVAVGLSEISSSPVNTFTVRYENPNFDEGENAQKIATKIRSNHHEVFVSDNDLLEYAHNQHRIFTEPFSDSSQIPAFFVSKFASQHVKVCLTGDGADELFGGYNRYIYAKKFHHFFKKSPKLLLDVSTLILSSHSFKDFLQSWAKGGRYALVGDLISKVDKFNMLLNSRDLGEFYNRVTSSPLDDDFFLINDVTNNFLNKYSINNWRDMLDVDLRHYMTDDNLQKIDRCSMYSGLECRVPFLDERIVNFSYELSNKLIINKNTKVILREYLKLKKAGDILNHPKSGFSAPLNCFLRTTLRHWAAEVIDKSKAMEIYGLDVAKFETYWKGFLLDDKRTDHNKIWNILVYLNWCNSK